MCRSRPTVTGRTCSGMRRNILKSLTSLWREHDTVNSLTSGILFFDLYIVLRRDVWEDKGLRLSLLGLHFNPQAASFKTQGKERQQMQVNLHKGHGLVQQQWASLLLFSFLQLPLEHHVQPSRIPGFALQLGHEYIKIKKEVGFHESRIKKLRAKLDFVSAVWEEKRNSRQKFRKISM